MASISVISNRRCSSEGDKLQNLVDLGTFLKNQTPRDGHKMDGWIIKNYVPKGDFPFQFSPFERGNLKREIPFRKGENPLSERGFFNITNQHI